MPVETGTQALRSPATSVLPGDGAHVRVRPLGSESVRITRGFWADRQRLNREVSIPAGHGELVRAGNFENLSIAAGRSTGRYRGRIFNDSDVYKWLEAVSWELAREQSADLRRLAAEAVELIEAAQGDDGYLNTYFTVAEPDARFTNPQEGHELYCAGHLMQAAVAHARSTGDSRLLTVARRCADHIDALFGPGRAPYVEGHPEIEMALVELYRVTGERRYLDLSCHFIDQRGHGWLGAGSFGSSYFQDHTPIREAGTVTGHAVRALYLAAGVTDVYTETGDSSLLTAMTRQWEDMVDGKMYLTGGVGSRHKDEAFGEPYELPPDRAYCETCAAISSVMWSWRMLLATGEARFAELIERTLYNGFAAATSLDGRKYFYVNPLQTRSKEATGPDHRGSGQREPWYRCACCPPNIMRLVSSLSHYLATVDEGGIQLHQYTSCTVSAGADGPTVRVETDYPREGRVSIVVENSPAGEWTLSLRVPSWSPRMSLAVNGEAVAVATDASTGYVSLRRGWVAGDAVSVDLDLSPRLLAPHHRVDAVRGCVAIERGPLVYCLEATDLPAGVELADVAVQRSAELTAVSRPDLFGGVTVVEFPGLARTRDGSLYDGAHRPDAVTSRPVRLTAIPYYAWANREAGPMRVWIPEA
ncbi:MAG: beta-L-arabinofuranosidase domain-containing protein [Mycobacteriales bacterium]